MREQLLAVSLCCLLVLAGCGGTGTGPTGTASPSDGSSSGKSGPDSGGGGDDDGGDQAGSDGRDGGDDETGTSTGPSAYPPGLDASGVTDRSALFAAHEKALATDDYAANLTQVAVVGGNRTTTTTLIRSDVNGKRAAGRFEVRDASGTTSVDTYRNATTLYRRQKADGETQYLVRNASGPFTDYHERQSDLLRSGAQVFILANFTGDGTIERDGRRLVRYSLAGLNESAIDRNTTVTSAEGELLVDERGVVHRAFVDLRGERDGESRQLRLEYRTTATRNVTVTRPEWSTTAEQEAGNLAPE